MLFVLLIFTTASVEFVGDVKVVAVLLVNFIASFEELVEFTDAIVPLLVDIECCDSVTATGDGFFTKDDVVLLAVCVDDILSEADGNSIGCYVS